MPEECCGVERATPFCPWCGRHLDKATAPSLRQLQRLFSEFLRSHEPIMAALSEVIEMVEAPAEAEQE